MAILVIVSGASGAGKTTVVGEALKIDRSLALSVSHTTRAKRAGEEQGVNYFFTSLADFLEMEARNEFLEAAPYNGNRYGTTERWVKERLAEGNDVVLEIEIKGAAIVRRNKSVRNVSCFIDVTPEVLRQRLLGRGDVSLDVIEERLKIAETERAEASKYDYVITNDRTPAEAAQALLACIKQHRGLDAHPITF